MIVLVDAGSASASEIVAAALQDHRRAIVMGERTFGKGSVQTLLPLGTGDTALRLTTARYYTPSGRSVQEGGITPDILVPQISDPDYRLRNRVRESDLRRHLVNEIGVQDDLIQDDGRPDPRFAATTEELTRAEHHRLPAPLCGADARPARPDADAAAAGRRRGRPAQRQPLSRCATRSASPRRWLCSCRRRLLAGAYGSQYWGGLAPCEMCYWQRYAHIAGLAFAFIALLAGRMPDRGR